MFAHMQNHIQRTPKRKPEDSIPLCLGKMWSLLTGECQTCLLDAPCSQTYHQDVTLVRLQKLEEQFGPYLDQANFNLVQWSLILDEIGPDGIEIKYLFDLVQAESKCTDSATVVQVIKNWIKTEGLRIQGGIVKKKTSEG